MSISLTTTAADRVRDQLAKRGHGVGLRVGTIGLLWMVVHD